MEPKTKMDDIDISSTEAPLKIKKKFSRLIFDQNSEALQLLNSYKKLRKGATLSPKDLELEKSLSERLGQLSEGLNAIENGSFLEDNSFASYIKMIKTTVSTSKTVLAEKEKAVESMETILKLKNEAENCMKYLEVKDDK